MIPKREFIFVRHGETDHNLYGIYSDEDIGLNATGREQANEIEALICTLPIESICHSPMRRAVETKDLISHQLEVQHHALDGLTECDGALWTAMTSHGRQELALASEGVQAYFERVQQGLIEALSKPGPVLIVAHGGVHWAICYLCGIEDHDWNIGNCQPVHFVPHDHGWNAANLAV